MNPDYINTVVYGDCRETLRVMRDTGLRVNSICTSPPYFSLRAYLSDDSPLKAQEIGAEHNLDAYLASLLEVFDLCRDLLWDDGSLWVVISDSYSGSGGAGGQHKGKQPKYRGAISAGVLKPKDLCLVPSRLAIAMQEAGWWVRCDAIWWKKNCLPPYAPGRPLRDHEYVWMFSKTRSPFFDQEAIRDKARSPFFDQEARDKHGDAFGWGRGPMYRVAQGHHYVRSVWSINPEPLSAGHFAAFPSALASRIIQLATSQRGHCPECGAGFKRIIEKSTSTYRKIQEATGMTWRDAQSLAQQRGQAIKGSGAPATGGCRMPNGTSPHMDSPTSKTLGWEPSCKCGKEAEPALVLDPFLGSGTTGMAAERLGRRWVGCELNEAYAEIIENRTAQQGLEFT